MSRWFAADLEDVLSIIVIVGIVLISIVSNLISAYKKRQRQLQGRAPNTERSRTGRPVAQPPRRQAQPWERRPQPPPPRPQQPSAPPGQASQPLPKPPDLREIARQLFGIPAPAPEKEPERPVEIELKPPPRPRPRPRPKVTRPMRPIKRRRPTGLQIDLAGLSQRELRRAVVMAEMLGPPLAKRKKRRLF
jgi:hypothetical protein